MIVVSSENTTISKVHTGRSLIHITCDKYVFSNHVFENGSVTTIVWDYEARFEDCEVHSGAIIVVTGKFMWFRTSVVEGAKIIGAVNFLILESHARLPNIKCKGGIIIHVGEPWSEEDLDFVCKHHSGVVNYFHNNRMTVLPNPQRFIDRMRANYRFTAGYIPPELDIPYRRRLLAHSLLAMVSARDVKGAGVRSALRKIPRYMVMMCGEMLW